MTKQPDSWVETVLLGGSALMHRVREQLTMLAALPWHVRISGPSGSGKNLAAHVLHRLSNRARGPFVACNLAMLPAGLELAELVGHRKGAFTGAMTDRPGAFETAHQGSLFLNEIHLASLEAQRALLQLVDEGTFSRVGETRLRVVDVRLVFATSESLEANVLQGRFREDLLYRLGFLELCMPALVEHSEDIPDLFAHLLTQKCQDARVAAARVTTAVLERLMTYSWPGNVRQLGKATEHFVAFGRLPDVIMRAAQSGDWRERLDEVLRRHGGKKAPAAAELGVSRETLYAELRHRRA